MGLRGLAHIVSISGLRMASGAVLPSPSRAIGGLRPGPGLGRDRRLASTARDGDRPGLSDVLLGYGGSGRPWRNLASAGALDLRALAVPGGSDGNRLDIRQLGGEFRGGTGHRAVRHLALQPGLDLGLVANLAAGPISSFKMMPALAIVAVLTPFGMGLAPLEVAGWGIELINGVTAWCAATPFAQSIVASGPAWMLTGSFSVSCSSVCGVGRCVGPACRWPSSSLDGNGR